MENPIIKQQERINNRVPYRRPIDLFDPCDICSRYESIIRLGKSKLCKGCASEEDIEVLEV